MLTKSSEVSLQSHEARLKRLGESMTKGDKKKETKQAANKASAGADDGSCKDAEECGKFAEQLTPESEQPRTNDEGTKGDSQVVNSSVGKSCDNEFHSETDDFTGEVSQEELEDGSDVEPDCLNSPEVDHDDGEIAQLDGPLSLPLYIKEEPLDCLSPPTSILDPLDYNEQEDPLTNGVKVKEEEGESGDALRQLLALETVANSQNIDDDADVVCIGESTRLMARVGENHRGQTAATNQVSHVIIL